jgi:hypothetical protein
MQLTAFILPKLSKCVWQNCFQPTLLLCLLCLSGCAVACQSNQELTNAQAQLLITESEVFKQPATISLVTRYENASEALFINEAGDSEKPEEVKLRALNTFLEFFPQIAVAHHFGLVTIETVFVKEEKANLIVSTPRLFFTFKVRANEKGKAMWKDYGLPENEESIPLARKRFERVTGVTKLAENQAQAGFTWKWQVNQAGEALEADSDEFKSLPQTIQNALQGKSANNYQAATEEWKGERAGSGLFQRFNDGWRLIRFY